MNQYISPCCSSFVLYNASRCICSHCQQEIAKITKKPVTIGVRFNADASNISGNAIENYMHLCKRFSTDPTYELCSVICDKCHSLCRYTKSPQNEFIFVCSNGECRNVFK